MAKSLQFKDLFK